LSNVSYNTDDFFASKIAELEKNGIIEWCYWIRHQPDTDETKAHIHFTLKPSKRIDTAKLREFFYEFDPTNSLPLTCTKKWNPMNSMDDWLLYAVHDIPYLNSKGEYRKFHYEFKDLKATDYDALTADWHAINRKKYYVFQLLEDYARKHIPFFVLVQEGIVPIAQRSQFQFQYNDLCRAIENEDKQQSGRLQSHEEIDEDGVIHNTRDTDM
jgi:hypothetical protein